jgi:hypothetical protein
MAIWHQPISSAEMAARLDDWCGLAIAQKITGLAIQICAAQEIAGLILISLFDSLVNVIRCRVSFFPDFLLQDKFKSSQYIDKVCCKVLSITGACDTTIPTHLTDALFSKWCGDLTEHVVPVGRHPGLLRHPSVEDEIALFLAQVIIDEPLVT